MFTPRASFFCVCSIVALALHASSEYAYADAGLTWKQEKRGGYVRLLSSDGKRALDANGGSDGPYMNNNLKDNDNLLWQKEDAGGGWFRLRPKVNPKVALDANTVLSALL